MSLPASLGLVLVSLAMAGPGPGRGASGPDDPVPQQAPAAEAPGREIPAAFAPFEYLVGRWKGQGVPKDNPAQRFRGWTETHAWAWTFARGKPTGLSVTIEGGKVLAAAKLSYDPDRKVYRLEGTGPKPGGGSVAFEGAIDRSGKKLVLDQVGPAPAPGAGPDRGALRLALWPNANFIRYTMSLDRKEPGAVLFHPTIEVGLGKEGESFAAGSTSGSGGPKCIVTGGAATMTLTYQGRTFPICCTGCRDEFNDNPEKYLKKAAVMAQSAGAKKAGQSPARVSRSEDAFAGDVPDEPAMKGKPASKAKGTPAKAKAAAADADDDDDAKASDKDKSATGKPAASPRQPAARAAGLLQIGKNLEKSGKAAAALGYYKRIVKDYAATPSAKTARERIKAIEKP